MADILSQEEINSLLEVLDEDEPFMSDYRISRINEELQHIDNNLDKHDKYITIKLQHYHTLRYLVYEYKNTLETFKNAAKEVSKTKEQQ